MTSVNTNAAALTALRTLQNTNSQLESVQSRISTGFKIGEAKDNAAYWAISTTLKSDNKALSTVKDALGLGASTVDTAYQGLNKAKDVLDEIKSKLTAATQDGVNRDTIQQEISQLQDQLKSIATSSVFSGENWLSVDSSAVSFNANKTVVASFSRDANGAVAIGTIGVNTANVSLFDASTAAGAAGILDKATSLVGKDGRNLTIGGTSTGQGNTGKAGLAEANVVGQLDTGASGSNTANGTAAIGSDVVAGTASNKGQILTGTINLTNVDASDTLTLKFKLDGMAEQSVTITKDTAASATDLAGKFTAALAAKNITGIAVAAGTTATTSLLFTRDAVGADKTIQLTDLTVKDSGGYAKNPTNAVFGLGNTFLIGAPNAGTDPSTNRTVNFTASKSEVYKTANTLNWTNLSADDKVTVNLSVDGQAFDVTVNAGANVADFVGNLNNNAIFANYAKASGTTDVSIASRTTGASSDVAFNSIVFKDKNGVVKNPAATNFEKIGLAATTSTGAFSTLTLDADDNIVFDIQLNNDTGAKTVSIDKALIDKTLGATANGTISSRAQYRDVINAALTKAGVTGVVAAIDGGGPGLTLTTTTAAGTNAKIAVSNLVASGGGSQISVDQIDISEAGLTKNGATSSAQIKSVLTAYISVVNTAINKITSAAASLGSVASRIDMQKSFVNTLMDTIDKGVGNLVDADMSEESTKLQALQVKQQLGVQSLSIANQSAQSVLSLFRG